MRYLSEQTMLPKDNMAGDAKAMSNRIITSIFFLSFTITKEVTKARTRVEFVVFMRLKKDETGRAKGSEMLIVRWRSKKALIRSLINVFLVMYSNFVGSGHTGILTAAAELYRRWLRQQKNARKNEDYTKHLEQWL